MSFGIYILYQAKFLKENSMKETARIYDCKSCNDKCLNHLFEEEEIIEFNNGATRIIQYKKGETILKQGSYAYHLPFLRNGLVKLVLESTNNRESIFQLSSSGSFICLYTMYIEDYIPFTVVALSNCEVCLIKREIFREHLLKNRKATEYVLSWYCNESLNFFKRMSVQSTRNNHGKLAEALLYLSKVEFKNENVSKYLTRNELAELASISLESTNKILGELKNDLIIRIKNEGIEIDNIDLLERLSRIG